VTGRESVGGEIADAALSCASALDQPAAQRIAEGLEQLAGPGRVGAGAGLGGRGLGCHRVRWPAAVWGRCNWGGPQGWEAEGWAGYPEPIIQSSLN